MTATIQIEIRNVYGVEKAYPADAAASCFAEIAGCKTLTRHTLTRVLGLGYSVTIVDRYGQPAKTFRPFDSAEHLALITSVAA
jgi:hypothetical protein